MPVADMCAVGCAVAAHLTAIQSALKMLSGRIGILYQHIQKMQDGERLLIYCTQLYIIVILSSR